MIRNKHCWEHFYLNSGSAIKYISVTKLWWIYRLNTNIFYFQENACHIKLYMLFNWYCKMWAWILVYTNVFHSNILDIYWDALFRIINHIAYYYTTTFNLAITFAGTHILFYYIIYILWTIFLSNGGTCAMNDTYCINMLGRVRQFFLVFLFIVTTECRQVREMNAVLSCVISHHEILLLDYIRVLPVSTHISFTTTTASYFFME